jgi:hypothetical protein
MLLNWESCPLPPWTVEMILGTANEHKITTISAQTIASTKVKPF